MSEVELFDHQKNFLDDIHNLKSPARACLYFKTGAGKSLTAMMGIYELGYTQVVVIAPPSTHEQWMALGVKLGIRVLVMSHAKFRMGTTLLSRKTAIIADEFHLFGGQKGQGWKKLDTLAQHLQAPLFLLSATPNYNDAERCYCIQHVLDPLSCRGGYLQFIYQHCDTEQNPFGMEPKVLGFRNFKSAAEFLEAMPGVYYLPDDLVVNIQDIPYNENLPDELINFGYNRRKHRMTASIMEERHVYRYQGLVNEEGFLWLGVYAELRRKLVKHPTMLIYANHATVAEALARTFDRDRLKYAVVTGETPEKLKAQILQEFREGKHNILIGTATLATGTDGLDRVCDTLMILDDTDDASLRRQLIGRIMPRGDYVATSAKQVFRMVPST